MGHAFVYGLGTVILQAAGLVLVPLYTRYLAPSDYGAIDLLSRLGEAINICLMANGIRMAALTFFKQAADEQGRREAAGSAIVFVSIAVLIGMALSVAGASAIGRMINIDDPWLVRFGLVAVLLEATTLVPLVLIQARIESVRFVCVTTAMFLTRIALALLLVAGMQWGVWGVLGASAVTSAGFGILLNVWEIRRAGLHVRLTHVRELFRFALPFLPGGLFFFILHSGDRFFLSRYAGNAAVGTYALAYKLATVASLASVIPLYKVWSARMYDEFKLPGAAAVFGRALTRILAAYLFVGMGLCILKEPILAVMGPPQYASAVSLMELLVLAYFFLSAADLMDAAFYLRRKTAWKPWIALVSMIVIVAQYALFIPRWGATGAALATLGGFLFHAGLTWAVSQRVFRVQYEVHRVVAMLLLASGLTWSARFLGTSAADVLLKVLIWASWPILLWLTRLITADEKAWVVERLRSTRHLLRQMAARQAA